MPIYSRQKPENKFKLEMSGKQIIVTFWISLGNAQTKSDAKFHGRIYSIRLHSSASYQKN